ncbi:MAG: hypothetical protein IT371_01515 [Deltaproteobacteria bacterium]|nr:hypothetical protein [Deltaproteobacteria bacterium]
MQLFPRVYRSFEEFERAELSRLDQLYGSITAMVDEMLSAELEEERIGVSDAALSDELDELCPAPS